MKTSFYPFLLLIALVVLSFGCKKNYGDGDDRPVFSFAEPIENPPDEFLVVFNTSMVGDRFALISFAEDAVWQIEKLGDGRISLFMSNDSINYPVTLADTLGLKAGMNYKIIVSNIYTSEFNNFFIGFNKLDLDYETFEPKF
jgi:hypothetical protein